MEVCQCYPNNVALSCSVRVEMIAHPAEPIQSLSCLPIVNCNNGFRDKETCELGIKAVWVLKEEHLQY